MGSMQHMMGNQNFNLGVNNESSVFFEEVKSYQFNQKINRLNQVSATLDVEPTFITMEKEMYQS